MIAYSTGDPKMGRLLFIALLHVVFSCPQYTRPASDVNMLGEMMFGSVAMSYKGSTLKIHYIR